MAHSSARVIVLTSYGIAFFYLDPPLRLPSSSPSPTGDTCCKCLLRNKYGRNADKGKTKCVHYAILLGRCWATDDRADAEHDCTDKVKDQRAGGEERANRKGARWGQEAIHFTPWSVVDGHVAVVGH